MGYYVKFAFLVLKLDPQAIHQQYVNSLLQNKEKTKVKECFKVVES